MSNKQKQWNCRAGINGWHEVGCPHQKPQSDWEKEWEEICPVKCEVFIDKEKIVCDFSEYTPKLKKFISAYLQKSYQDGYAKCKEELLKLHNLEDWVVDKAFQDGYAKGRIRCLEQHHIKELQATREETLKEVLPKRQEVNLNFGEHRIKLPEVYGFNSCRQEIINKVLQKWGIKLK